MTNNDNRRSDPSTALLGVPTGEETLSRNDVDGLEFSTKQPKRPRGVSRAQYMRAGPGSETRPFIDMAGISRRRPIVIVATCVLLTVVGVAGFLVLRG